MVGALHVIHIKCEGSMMHTIGLHRYKIRVRWYGEAELMIHADDNISAEFHARVFARSKIRKTENEWVHEYQIERMQCEESKEA